MGYHCSLPSADCETIAGLAILPIKASVSRKPLSPSFSVKYSMQDGIKKGYLQAGHNLGDNNANL